MNRSTADTRAKRASMPARAARAVAAICAAGLVGCAAQQVVPLSIEPSPAEVYVDGKRAPGGQPDSLSLRVDRSHVVLVRREGYLPQQVVVESVGTGGERRLSPDRISLRLEPERHRGRHLEVELDPAQDGPASQ